MNQQYMIKVVLYKNDNQRTKICSSYVQSLPRTGELITVLNDKFIVEQIEHTLYPISTTDTVSWNMNQHSESGIAIICTKT
ncbi:hypothetical protein ACQ27_gp296 [Klebsiella phage K64-1]|uniref:hypothetical protein n=1 Tax=Klebsiella phage K64-1 TaxID=1439894 RepID=UPI0018A5FADE|nr:hypothetical protein ACQ27_gp296 [Klebsiella phage K64-1]QOE32648.1 hypothetical protein CPT_Muenster_482 [Klebsiella phage Muenster]